MNRLNKELTGTEKILLVILGIVIIGALYYLLIFTPIENGIEAARSEQQALETELSVTKARLEKIERMQADVSSEDKSGISYMPSYNAGKEEIDFLHTLLGKATDYSVKFTNISREEDLIRRDFAMSYTAGSLAQAEKILKELEDSELRCLVGDMSISPFFRESNLQDGEVTVSLSGTFYETMHGGTPDKELPEDQKKE
ncbi:type II secretion system protein GspM [Butyrivibrio sp. FC2001]|uniref:type II secretion system protein GspM n=1 Tax=Butyrivibrio sp. FC2001 TaxID=1280671 RepID=UPI00040CE4E6|nr:type II secretion system protein GspM [Butyrivibrio sp. FC2001]